MNDKQKKTYIVFFAYFFTTLIIVSTFVVVFIRQESYSYDGKTTLQITFNPIYPVGNESDPQNSTNAAFDVWKAPPNSFGIREQKTVNWSWFWKVFRKNCKWQLEAWHPIQQIWVSEWQGTNLNEWLNISRIRNTTTNASEKITLNVTNNHPTQDLYFRFKFGIDIRVKDYINKSSWYEYTLTYPANATENYTVFFNFSDVKPLIQNGVLLQKHGVKNDLFYFMLTQNRSRNPLKVGKSFEIDPWFGNQDAHPSTIILDDTDDVIGCRFYLENDSCVVDSITMYCNWDNIGSAPVVRCLIYDFSDMSFVTNGQSDAKTVSWSGTGTWTTLSFSTSPTLNSGWYILAVHGANSNDWFYLRRNTAGGHGHIEDQDCGSHYPNYPDPLTNDSWVSGSEGSIYATYNISSANDCPWGSFPNPSNNSVSQSVESNFNVTITDNESNTWGNISISRLANTSSWSNQGNGSQSLDLPTLAWNSQYTVYVNYSDSGEECIMTDKYFFTTEDHAGNYSNTCPTSSNPVPANSTTNVDVDIGQFTVDINDANGNATWGNLTCSNGNTSSWVNQANGTRTLEINTTLSYSTSYTVWCNYSDDYGCTKNDFFTFTTEADTITFNFINMTPSDLLISSTGNLLITYNVTTNDTGLNQTSLLIAHVLNNTRTSHLNNTYTLYAENWVPDKKCAINRNYPYWFETEFSYLTGDDSIGDIGEWAVHNETLYQEITINSQGSNWINFTHNISILENLFGNIFLVNREAQTIEDKTGQTFDVYKDIAARVNFEMNNTQWWNDTEYNNTYYTLHFYAEPVSPDKDLLVYFANDSYTTGNPLTSDYCELIGTVTTTQGYDYTVLNSSYYDISFSADENGTIGAVSMTENFSFIFASNAKDSTHKWVVYYADDNITILDEYHDFKNSSSSMTCIDKGVTWVAQDGTIDTFLTYGHLDNIDRVMYKVYCQMNGTATGDGQWSSAIVDVLDETNLPPNTPNIITPNGSAPTEDYRASDIINVTYSWLGDPNLDTCWLNITVHNDTHTVVYYLQNRSITSDEYEVNSTWWYDWDTSGLSTGGPFHINVTATDDNDAFRDSEQEGTFWLNNSIPTQSGEAPVNTSIDIGLTPSLFVICSDNDTSDVLNATWRSNSSGSWVDFATNQTISTGTNITQDNSNFSAYSTTYWWSVNLSDGIDWNNETYHFTTTGIPYANTCPTSSNPIPTNNSIDQSVTVGQWNATVEDSDGNNTWGNISISRLSNTTSWSNQANGSRVLELNVTLAWNSQYTVWINYSDDFGCNVYDTYFFTTVDHPANYSNTCPVSSSPSIANGSTGVSRTVGWFNITINDANGNNTWGNMSINNNESNTSSWSNQANGTRSLEINATLNYSQVYRVWVNYSDDFGCNVTDWFEFTTESSLVITITSPFPEDEEGSAPLQPTIYATINSSTGATMNVSWYWGTSSGNENTLIGTDSSFTNSTQVELFFEANTRSTNYYWRACANDGTNYQNETFSFRTEPYVGGGGSMPNYQVPMAIGASALMIGLLALLMKRKKKRRRYE